MTPPDLAFSFTWPKWEVRVNRRSPYLRRSLTHAPALLSVCPFHWNWPPVRMCGCGDAVVTRTDLGGRGAVELLRVTFPVSGSEIPLDHGYAVFSAVSRL